MISAATIAVGVVAPIAGAQTATTAAVRRVVGTTVQDRFGANRVVIYVRGTKITGLTYSLPTDRPRSKEINAHAGPILRTEALRAQSARINKVSGATYTSDAFAKSLQAAITRAHIG
jgi:uncharacterized protein with FMN-binding domain